ncbi:MAG: phosphoenolpyruvate kinase [Bacteroidia bacterium]|nr:phosphoenolpyruvate kinase [Bacteroidia bacterium]
MKTSIPQNTRDAIFDELRTANLAFQHLYPGDTEHRQPVHTVYGGADLFSADTASKMGEIALRNLKEYAPDFTVLARVLQLPGHQHLPTEALAIQALQEKLDALSAGNRDDSPAWLTYDVYNRVVSKLQREAVEDFRIDFEDGFGNRSDEEEDQTAVQAAREVAKGMKNGTLPPFIGIRVKPFTEEMKHRGARTLDIFITALSKETGGKLPENFIVMLPKVTIPEQVRAMVRLLEALESNTELAAGSLKMEMMVETTQAVMSSEGTNPLMKLVKASEGRMTRVAFGTYDYTASNNITAMYQDMGHPVCDFAHLMTKVALNHTGIFLSDGATNTMPVGPHRGANLTPDQVRENTAVVHRAWKMAYDHNRHSLYMGLYQGWDLNPAQLPVRYAAVFAFFLESFAEAANRLSNFVGKAARATLSGDIFDDAATGQGLLNYFLRAINSGAISIEDATASTGLTIEEFRSRSFLKILEGRRVGN